MKLILGTMTFGEQIFDRDVCEIIDVFLNSGYNEIDTAYVYNDGKCEELLGKALKCVKREKYKIATKVNPRISGRLDKQAVLEQLNTSLNRLNIDKADILYLHFPDSETPIEYALEGCAELYDAGKFLELGLSNFPAWLVAEVYRICEKNGWMLPKVYEGLYNPLSRFAERELSYALECYKMRFYAYNPLAGGMLTDKYSGKDRLLKAGRFINRPNYQQRYWKDSFFNATDMIKEVCSRYNINIADAAYRWLSYHSMLKEERGDGIIVGISKQYQLEQNIKAASDGKLPEEIVTAFEKGWEISRQDAPEYFKYYISKQ